MKVFTRVIMALVIIGLIAVLSIGTSFNDHTYTITVTDKERINKNDDSYYLIFTEKQDGDTLVLKNEDNLFRGKFNSSDVYAQMDVGCAYEVTVVGFRFPLISMYENIIKIEPIE